MRVVIALGGNALLQRGEPMTAEAQRANVRVAAPALAAVALQHQLVLSHGNGPQVGLLALQAAAYQDVEPYPLDILGAQTEGMIGYVLEQELGNILPFEVPFATLLTMIEVDPADPAFDKPTKYVGPVYDQAEAEALSAEKGWDVAPDGDRWRRVVPSPEPKRIFAIRPIRWLLDQDVVVICAGGGGIPTMYAADAERTLVGVEAVIDKDLASELLAREVNANLFVMVTDVDGVYLNWGTLDQRRLESVTPEELREARLRRRVDGTQGRSCRPLRRTHRNASRHRQSPRHHRHRRRKRRYPGDSYLRIGPPPLAASTHRVRRSTPVPESGPVRWRTMSTPHPTSEASDAAGDPAAGGVPRSLKLASEITWRTALVVAGALAVIWVFLELSVVTVPAFVALLAATVLYPPVVWLRDRGWPRLLATWTVLLGVVALVVAGVALLVPAFLAETEDLGTQLDEGIAEVENWLETGPLGIENADIKGALDSAADQLMDAGPALFEGVTVVVEVLAGMLIALVMVFFFIKDGPKITDWASKHMPATRRDDWRRASAAAWSALGAYFRGTLVVGIVNGTAIGIGLAILGVPLALPLAVITAASAFFPVVGAVVAGALAALVALVTEGPVDALIVVGLTVAVQQLEGDVLSPVIMGRVLSLHPLVILVVLTIGAVTAGILGAFLAVPVTAMAIAATSSLRQARLRNDLPAHPAEGI